MKIFMVPVLSGSKLTGIQKFSIRLGTTTSEFIKLVKVALSVHDIELQDTIFRAIAYEGNSWVEENEDLCNLHGESAIILVGQSLIDEFGDDTDIYIMLADNIMRDWKPLKSDHRDISNSVTQHISVSGSGSGSINIAGNSISAPSMNVTLAELSRKIDESDDDNKDEAKSKLESLLKHPLVVTILGVAAGGIIG